MSYLKSKNVELMLYDVIFKYDLSHRKLQVSLTNDFKLLESENFEQSLNECVFLISQSTMNQQTLNISSIYLTTDKFTKDNDNFQFINLDEIENRVDTTTFKLVQFAYVELQKYATFNRYSMFSFLPEKFILRDAISFFSQLKLESENIDNSNFYRKYKNIIEQIHEIKKIRHGRPAKLYKMRLKNEN